MQSLGERIVQAKTTDFLRRAEHLRKLAERHEKERKWKSFSDRNDFKDCLCTLEELENRFNSEFKTEVMKVQQQLQKIRQSVFRFQVKLTDVRPSPDLLEKLKDLMGEIESSISTFKEQEHQSFEELLKEERTCWQEICAFEKKVDAWSFSLKKDSEFPRPPNTRLCVDRKGNEDLPAEVTALEIFLQQNRGQLGGWDQYDHQSFLKVWTKHRGKPPYRSEVKLYLPGKTEEDIRLHEAWYLELRHLQEKKKEAIQKWRSERQKSKEAHLQECGAERREHEGAAAEAQRLKQQEQRKEVATRLEAWRSQRRQQHEQEEEQKLRNEILQRKRLKEERRRQLEVKMAVEAHTRQKKEEEELWLLEREAQEQMEMEERRRLAAEGIRRFQNRDLHKLEVKLQEKQAKEEEELERQRKQAKLKEKVDSCISRNPSRLWKPTKGWVERTKIIGPTGGGPVYQMFHRAVPSWRQGL